MYEVQFNFKDFPLWNAMFFDELDDALKFAKEKELDPSIVRVSVYEVLYKYLNELE